MHFFNAMEPPILGDICVLFCPALSFPLNMGVGLAWIMYDTVPKRDVGCLSAATYVYISSTNEQARHGRGGGGTRRTHRDQKTKYGSIKGAEIHVKSKVQKYCINL